MGPAVLHQGELDRFAAEGCAGDGEMLERGSGIAPTALDVAKIVTGSRRQPGLTGPLQLPAGSRADGDRLLEAAEHAEGMKRRESRSRRFDQLAIRLRERGGAGQKLERFVEAGAIGKGLTGQPPGSGTSPDRSELIGDIDEHLRGGDRLLNMRAGERLDFGGEFEEGLRPVPPAQHCGPAFAGRGHEPLEQRTPHRSIVSAHAHLVLGCALMRPRPVVYSTSRPSTARTRSPWAIRRS